jgi:hypothetical protein
LQRSPFQIIATRSVESILRVGLAQFFGTVTGADLVLGRLRE